MSFDFLRRGFSELARRYSEVDNWGECGGILQECLHVDPFPFALRFRVPDLFLENIVRFGRIFVWDLRASKNCKLIKRQVQSDSY